MANSPEFELIARHFTRPAANAVLGVGDDCALVDVTNGMDLAVSIAVGSSAQVALLIAPIPRTPAPAR